jgi:hypothetical protein
VLRASLQELHRQLTASGAEPGSDDYARPAEDILDATEHLLAAEAAAALAATERHRATQARLIRAIGATTAAGLLIFTAVYLSTGWAGPVWLILFVPVILAAAGLAWLEPTLPGGEPQNVRGAAAGLLTVSALLGALTAARVVPSWVTILAVLATAGAGAAWILSSTAGAGGRSEPERAGQL